MRIALLTMDSPLSDQAVAAFVADPGPARVVLIGCSDPLRAGATALLLRRWKGSGWRLLPYLVGNYGLPALLRRAVGGGTAKLAAERRIPWTRVADVNGAGAQALREAQPDLLVTLHFDQILSPTTIALAPLGGINLHPSLLPRHRGPLPTFWALSETPPATGVSVHRLAARIDGGAILARRAVAIRADVTASAAARALHVAGVPLLREAITRIASGEAAGDVPASLPYCPFPSRTALRKHAGRRVRLFGPADAGAMIWGA